MYSRLLIWFACVFSVAFAVTGCSKSETPLVPVVTETFSDDATRHEFVDASNAFAFDLYGRLREREGNLVVSPVSVSTALGMVLAGARGETEREIKAVLHVSDLSRDEAHRAAADLQNDLNGRGKERDFALSVANRLWAQKDQTILDEFTALMQTHYGAEIGRVDFINKPDAALKQVNAWAAKATHDKIATALDREDVDELTRLVLVNAVYYFGKWEFPFKRRDTGPLDFYRSDETKLEVPTMFKKGYLGFRQTDGLKVLRMPYQGGKLSMSILLPDQIDGIHEIESQLTQQMLRNWTNELESTEVLIWLPKFKFTVGLQFESILAQLGMSHAFDARTADLSGIDGIPPSLNRDEGLCIQKVIHRAIIEVDEEGTEAAATTTVKTTTTTDKEVAPPKEFRADHPFLFFIQDEETGAILFMGRVVDPTQD